MNATSMKNGSSGNIRHLPEVTAASLPPLVSIRAKGLRWGALILLLTCGLFFTMNGAGLARAVTDGPGIPFTAGFDNQWSPADARPLPGHYIDGSVPQAWRIKAALARHTSGRGFHLFSHGRPGELLLGGRWRNAGRIAAFVRDLPGFDGRARLNIYGCNFAAGEKGRAAVRYLTRALDLPVSASDDVTGRSGDWELEVGQSASAVRVPAYTRSLQTNCDVQLHQVFNLTGSARSTTDNPNEIQLTDNSTHQAGAAMSFLKVDFRMPFTITFRAFLGNKDWNGSDGMAAVFHNDPRGTAAIGYPRSALGAGGIRNGIALEVDTWIGSSENWAEEDRRSSWWMDHTAIWQTDVLFYGVPSATDYLTTAIGHGDLEDGQWHDVVISWATATRTLSYTLDGANAGSYTHGGTTDDFFAEYFGGASRVHFGITAATGGLSNFQRIELDYCSLPLPTDTDGDGVADSDDLDDDNDGITDIVEESLYYPDPTLLLFDLNGTARLQFVYPPPRYIRLTENHPDRAGAAMSEHKIDYSRPFTIAFDARFGTNDRNGSDGMAAVFHNDPRGSAAIGYARSALGAGSIRNGIALEFDTWNGSFENWGDGNRSNGWMDHTSIWNTDIRHPGVPSATDYLTTAIGHGNLEDGQWHDVEISWDPATRTLSYTLDGANAGSYTHDGTTDDFFATYFGGASRVHFGITAATGGLTNEHDIHLDDFNPLLFVSDDQDSDGDGVPNRLDLDSDADGISDLEESGTDHATLDTNKDGAIDIAEPVGANGLADIIESYYGEDNGVTPKDTGGYDGHPDFVDRDSDRDGCPDAIEGDRIPSYYYGDLVRVNPPRYNSSALYWGLDQSVYTADDRGRHLRGEDLGAKLFQSGGSAYDSQVNACNNVCSTGDSDFDGDGIPDICDIDDDNDGITDCVDNGLDNPQLADIFTMSGSAIANYYRKHIQVALTPDSPGQAGAVMSKHIIDFGKPFFIAFDAHFGTKDGADGMAMVFHNDPDGSDALGLIGSALGAGGIQNGIALELDTFAGSGEMWADHTSIWDTDQMGGYLGREPQSYLTAPIGHGDLEDGRWHDVEVNWDPATRTLSYTLDGANAGSFTHSGTTDDFFAEYFGGTHRVHFGITAATGGYANLQSIRFYDKKDFFNFCALPIDVDIDGDGVPNRLDLDSDGDRRWDLEESGADYTTLDTNYDGIIDNTFPVSGNGLADTIEDTYGENNGIPPKNSDNDNLPDFRDAW